MQLPLVVGMVADRLEGHWVRWLLGGVLSVVLVLLLLDRQAIESRLTALEDDRRTIRDQLTVVMTNQQRVMVQLDTTDPEGGRVDRAGVQERAMAVTTAVGTRLELSDAVTVAGMLQYVEAP